MICYPHLVLICIRLPFILFGYAYWAILGRKRRVCFHVCERYHTTRWERPRTACKIVALLYLFIDYWCSCTQQGMVETPTWIYSSFAA